MYLHDTSISDSCRYRSCTLPAGRWSCGGGAKDTAEGAATTTTAATDGRSADCGLV